MKLRVVDFNGFECGDIELNDDVFAVSPNTECIADVIRWQLAKRQAGTHDVKGRGEVNRTKKKNYRQKGTGRARHGARTANLFVGGGIVFGPTPRSHMFKLNKKVKKLALKSLLSLKVKDEKVLVLDNFNLRSYKTKDLTVLLSGIGLSSALFVKCNEEECCNFVKACKQLYMVDIIPAIGLNAYDILKHKSVVFTKNSIKDIENRLLG